MHRLALRAMAGFAVLAGCLSEQTKQCANGATCPFDEECTEVDPVPGAVLCGPARLVEQCRGKSDFDACGFVEEDGVASIPGACNQGLCVECTENVAGCSYPGWTAMTSGTTTTLNDVWVISRSNAYAIGEDGLLLHYDGLGWQAIASIPGVGHLISIWGSDPTNLFVTTSFGRVMHGAIASPGSVTWTEVASSGAGQLTAISGSGPTDIVAVGIGSDVLQFDGSDWIPVASGGAPIFLSGVWVIDSRTAWACGQQGTIVRRENGVWASSRAGVAGEPHLLAIHGRTPAETFATGGKFNNGSDPRILEFAGNWTSPDVSNLSHLDLHGLWSDGGRLFGVGEAGVIVQYDGTWSEQAFSSSTLNAMGGTSETDFFVVGRSGTIGRNTDL